MPMQLILVTFFIFLLLVAFTPLLGYTDKKWVLPLMWGLFALFSIVGWVAFLGIGWLDF